VIEWISEKWSALITWIANTWASLTWAELAVGIAIFVVSLIISFVAIGVVMVNIPADYFSSESKRDFMPGRPFFVRWGAVIAKNIFGVFLVALGIALSLPGVPGQGALTILLGIIMLDIPGKRPFEARIIKRPAVRDAINRLRARYDRPELILD
jgi:hypothetical protein